MWTDNTPMDMGSPWWYEGQPDDPMNSHFACLWEPNYNLHSCQDSNRIYGICQL